MIRILLVVHDTPILMTADLYLFFLNYLFTQHFLFASFSLADILSFNKLTITFKILFTFLQNYLVQVGNGFNVSSFHRSTGQCNLVLINPVKYILKIC